MKIDSLDSWDPPPEGVFKLNFDGASTGNPDNARFGAGIKKHVGDIIWIFFGNISYERNNTTKLEGLVEWVSIYKRKNLLPLIAEGDSEFFLPLTTKIHHGSQVSKLSPMCRLEHCLLHFESYLKQTMSITFHHVRWKANFIADFLASEGVTCNQPL